MEGVEASAEAFVEETCAEASTTPTTYIEASTEVVEVV